ncbi:hypothetical protein [Phyllobacterium zundukense]|uniref:Uncharacterized protein n=2 Tax=Phyllobacterium zundukense TaxID=1867719 RepID=A0ACD4CYV2_9HYPH|nr:hypothetical protein [Phyllobacterium zundukense]UXN58639.1 hypothetical protein N8E88_11655 [Phyllobacterium zundukense]UXN58775.1 hypothetical protein N8E88_07555 [Phyllobacterium zundukense]
MAKLKERSILAVNKLVGSGCKPRAAAWDSNGGKLAWSGDKEPQYSVPLLCRDHQEC